MERYSFPELSSAEIFSQLKQSLGIAINSEDELNKPKPDCIKNLYIQLLEIVLHKNRDEFLLLKSNNTKTSRITDISNTAISALNLYKNLSKILSQIGCKKDHFKINDLIAPESRRTKKFFSAIINFIRFMTEEQEQIFEQNPETMWSRVAAEECQKAKDEYERKLIEVQTLQRKNQEKQPIIDQKKARIDSLLKEKQVIVDEKTILENDIDLLEIESAGLEDAKGILYENSEKACLKILKEKHTDGNTSGIIEEKFKQMENILTILKDTKPLIDNCELAKSRYVELEKQVSAQKEKSKELDEEISQIKMNLPSFENLETSSSIDSSGLIELLKEKQTEKDYLFQKKEGLEQELVEKQDKLNRLTEEFLELQANHHAQMKALQSEHSKIITKAEEYKENAIKMIRKSEMNLENKENESDILFKA